MKPQTLRRLRAALIGLACVTAVPVVLVPVSAAAEVPAVKRIAIVDMQRVLNETNQGKAGRSQLESSSKHMQTQLDKKRTKLEADAQKLSSLKGAALAKAQEELQNASMELQSMLMTNEESLANEHNKLLESMYKRAQEIVSTLARERTLDLVLVRDSMTVIFAKEGLDITEEIVKRYDKKHAAAK